jgi:ATP-dependent DNA helicase RecQ
MSGDIFQKAVEKLASQGAAQIDMNGLVRANGAVGSNSWRGPYEAQVAHRRGQIDAMVAFAEASQCRMTGLIRHFGDIADSTRTCGHCDVCAPGSTAAQSYRTPDTEDLRQFTAILYALQGQSRSTGKLHSELAASALRGTPAGGDRRTFDALLDALVRGGLVSVTVDTFTNGEGNQITYKKAGLTQEGREAASNGSLHTPDLLIKDAADASPSKSGKSGTKSKSSSTRSAGSTKAAKREAPSFTPAQKDLEARLRDWRKAEAAKTGKPAFIVFSDSSLENIVLAAPHNIAALLQVSGIGPEKADRYGAAIIALCNSSDQSVPGDYGAPASQPSAPRSAPKRARQESPSSRSKPRQDSFPTLAATPTERPSRPRVVDEGPTYTRPRAATPEPADSLTPEQQLLDQSLRDWRKEEAERLGLPQFFVLGSSALRSIVLERPRTLAQLQKINGIGLEKVEEYGAGILQVCNP